MIFIIEMSLSIVAMVIFCIEDRRRRKYGHRPVWSNTVFKILVGGLTALLIIVFIAEDGAWLIRLLDSNGTDSLSAIACAIIITAGGGGLFGIISYLMIIPDDDPDLQLIADAIYYDGND